VAIAVVGDRAWDAFRACVGWPEDARWSTLAGRRAARAELDARVAAWTRERTPDDAAAALQAAGVSAMAVEGADDLRADPHLAGRGAIVTVEHPEIGSERHVANPIRPSRTPLAQPRPAPLLGEHTEEILTAVLGLDRAEVARLAEDGVCR
jgi:benzylsuccinate CoA-transferase BbsF subunit